MILGQSTFESVLDRLDKERADAPQSSSAAWTRIRGLNAGFVGTGSEPESLHDRQQLHAAYLAHSSDVSVPPGSDVSAPAPKPAIDVSIFERLSREEIVNDIKLQPSDTRAELQLKRRNFARLNHPDRAPEEWRDAATIRMKIANQLIDEALRKTSLEKP